MAVPSPHVVSTNTELRLAFLLLDDGKNPESPLTSDTTQVRRGRSASLLQMEVQTSHGVSSDTVGTRWSLLTIKNESSGFLNGLLWHPGVRILECTFPGFLCRESKLFSRSLFVYAYWHFWVASSSIFKSDICEGKKPRAFTPCCSLSPMVLSQSAFFSVLFSLLIFVLYTVFGVLGCKWKGEYGKEQLSPWK